MIPTRWDVRLSWRWDSERYTGEMGIFRETLEYTTSKRVTLDVAGRSEQNDGRLDLGLFAEE